MERAEEVMWATEACRERRVGNHQCQLEAFLE